MSSNTGNQKGSNPNYLKNPANLADVRISSSHQLQEVGNTPAPLTKAIVSKINGEHPTRYHQIVKFAEEYSSRPENSGILRRFQPSDVEKAFVEFEARLPLLQQQMQHRHEVRLTGTETAVQIASFAAHPLDSGFDKSECILETNRQLGRDDVLFQSFFRLGNPFGELEHEIPFMNSFGEFDQFTDERFHGFSVFSFQFSVFSRLPKDANLRCWQDRVRQRRR